MDRDHLRELALYYITMLLLVVFTLEISRAVVGEISFLIELAVIFAIVFAYRTIAVRLGFAPSSWE